MNRYQAALRIAHAISNHGWGSLSTAEESVLSSDEEFLNTVEALVQKLNREKLLLQTDNETKEHIYAVTPFSKENECIANTDWQSKRIARRAELWTKTTTENKAIEIKEWSIDNYHNAQNIGPHELILQRTIKADNVNELKEQIEDILKKYNCPDSNIKEFIDKI